jgi:ribonuclease T2
VNRLAPLCRHSRAGAARPENPGPQTPRNAWCLGSRIEPESDDRKRRGYLLRFIALAALLLAIPTVAAAQDRPGDFDFYVLSLSWSPTFCAQGSDARDSEQCRDEAEFGFVVHGLWPQNERGYPENCSERPERVPGRLAASMLDIMPDWGLVQHEWRQHGSCTGLSMTEYFAKTRAAWERIKIPPDFRDPGRDRRSSARQIEDAFVAGNPGLREGGIAISCEDGRLEEVRICLTRDLAFRACREVDRRGCRQNRLRIPAAD